MNHNGCMLRFIMRELPIATVINSENITFRIFREYHFSYILRKFEK